MIIYHCQAENRNKIKLTNLGEVRESGGSQEPASGGTEAIQNSSKHKPGTEPHPQSGLFRVLILGLLSKRGQRSGDASTAGHAGREKPVLPVAENTGDSMGAASAVTDRG